MKIPFRDISDRNTFVSLHNGHFRKYPAFTAYCCTQSLWNQELFRQHGDWIDSMTLYWPIFSQQIAHVSLGLWRKSTGNGTMPLWFGQNDWNAPVNSKLQSCWIAQGKWNALRHRLSQQLMLAPLFRQKVHRCHQNSKSMWLIDKN